METKTKAKKSQDITLLNMKGVSIVVHAPYCTAEEWAERTGISARGVKEQIKRGQITAYQQVERGVQYVNVLAEMSKLLEVKAY